MPLDPKALGKAIDAIAQDPVLFGWLDHDDMYDMSTAAITAYLAAISETHVLVPRVATDAMLDAAWEIDRMDPNEPRLPLNPGWSEDQARLYTAMIKAAEQADGQ